MKKHRVFFLAAAAGAVLCLCQGPQSQAWAQVRTPQAAGTAVYGNGLLFWMLLMQGKATV